jgi:N-acetylneuraminic acid mutarotase
MASMKKKSSSRSVGGRALIALVLFIAGGCLVASGTLPASFHPEAAAKASKRTLTFAERVTYQRAIEEVRWRHRIWPKDRPDPKPSLDAVMSRAQIEKKVTGYLRKSQLLADEWGRPITVSELQAEMERMASHTKQPDVLRELFGALGNDPFVIAECLARPLVAERLASELSRQGGVEAFVPNAKTLTAATALTSQSYKLPQISVPLDCADDTWTATTTVNAPDARREHTAVWTGSEMIVWGGVTSIRSNTGGRYNPSTDSWAATSLLNAPTGRDVHTAVWTGSEMIVWGGEPILNTGGRYNPILDTWTATSTANAPIARASHTAVWTGGEMIVWGGRDGSSWFNTGGRYNPVTDSWTATSTTSAPSARWDHRALWTGGEMIVWGGTDQTNYLHTGGRYNAATDSWTPTGLVNVPPGRIAYTAVWTGGEMIVWGGVDEFFNVTNTGGRYNPSTDSWIGTASGSGPSARADHSAVWTGSEVVIWGGYSQIAYFNTGGRYNPGTDSWTLATTANAPLARGYHTAVWTGNEMIVWGGSDDTGNELNTGGSYCAQPSAPIVQSAASGKTHGNAGSFGVNLPLSGTPGIECRSGGATSDYTIVVTFLANVSVNGNPQAAVTSGTGTIGSGGVSNGGMVVTSGNVVTIPLTNVANAQTMIVTLNNVNGSTNVTIPMSVLIGDVNGNGAVNASDVALSKSRSGQPVAAATFRSDVNADGSINASDVAFVKSLAGTGLP